MTNYNYQLIEQPNFASITVFHDGEIYFATKASHDNYDTIVDMVVSGDPGAIDLFDLTKAVKRYTDRAFPGGRVEVRNAVVYFDGEPLNTAIAELILRMIDEDADPLPLVRFLENINENPNPHSRNMLFDWLNAHKFSITESGWIVGYKGVNNDFTSITSGPGRVNGVDQNGNLDNSPGNVLSVDRGYVAFDPAEGCSTGLHVGTWDYARGFGPTVVEVHVHPKDVVSVPTDCHSQKMRAAEYKVVRKVEKAYEKVLVLG